MEDYNSNNPDLNKTNKQKFLIAHIIEAGYDANEFSEFLLQEKKDGNDIDNWTIEELETEVSLFKRQTPNKQPKDVLKFKLEDICVDTTNNNSYIKRMKTKRKKKTFLSDIRPYILIEQVDVKEGGLFYGKYLCFSVSIPERELRVKRTESEFKWLSGMLAKEFPFTPLPPLVRVAEKTFDEKAVTGTKKNFERFLNECVRHPELKKSNALEIFLVSESKAEFDGKSKEFSSFISKASLFPKSLTKKGSDYCKDPVSNFPTPTGQATIKISQFVESYIDSTESQYYHYNVLFEQLEKLYIEYEKCQKRMVNVNAKIKRVFDEFQETAMKYNSTKPFKSNFAQVEDKLFGTVSGYFRNYGWLIRRHSCREREII